MEREALRTAIKVINALDTEADMAQAGRPYYGLAATPAQLRQWSAQLEAELTFVDDTAQAITPQGLGLALLLLREQFLGWDLTPEGWERRNDPTEA